MRVTLDTNLLISAGIFAGKRTTALTLRIADEHNIVLSSQIIDELRGVMDIKFPDKKDYPILASAIIADVDVFITGDKDFGGLDLKRPEIMTISEFEQKYL